MKRFLLCIPLLSLAPLGSFLGPYLSGLGVLTFIEGIFIASVCMLICPLIVSIVLATVAKSNWGVRLMLFVATLIVQGALLFFVGPPATTEMMGIAHRLRREFPTDQLRDCANQLRVKFRNGTLKLKKRGTENYFPVNDSAVEVESEELPASLRGRFQRVFIQEDPSTGDEQVIFALDPEMGIICDNEKNVREFHFYSIAEGIEAYYDQR